MNKLFKSLFAIIGLALASGQVNAQCTAEFDTTINGLIVGFTNQASGGYNYIEYDYGDGNYEAYVSSPSHTYATAGIFEACQYIMDTVNFNCFDEHCETLYLGGATCQADFYPYIDGLDIEVYNESLGIYDSIWIDFGDGNGTSDTIGYHTYANTGYYTICLSIFDSSSLCDSVCYEIYVDDAGCDADFSYNDDNLDVDFTDQSSGNYNSYYWDFGDNFGSSEEANPSYTYFAAGTYEVCLYIYDSVWGSCEADYCEFVTVENGGGSGDCKAKFKYIADQLDFSFTNQSTGGIISTWDFGDGTNPSFDENPTHTFAMPGTYEVCVTIINPFPFCTDTYCEFVEANEYTCEPTFTYSSNSTNAFTFVNTTAVGNITSVLWSFGDGNTSTFAQPTYTYNAPGTYTVCLTTYDEGNECGKTCDSVDVYPLGIIEAYTASDFRIVPNPNAGIFAIQTPATFETGEFTMQIVDLGGRLVYENKSIAQENSIQINADLAKGAYMLMLKPKGRNAVNLKLIVE